MSDLIYVLCCSFHIPHLRLSIFLRWGSFHIIMTVTNLQNSIDRWDRCNVSSCVTGSLLEVHTSPTPLSGPVAICLFGSHVRDTCPLWPQSWFQNKAGEMAGADTDHRGESGNWCSAKAAIESSKLQRFGGFCAQEWNSTGPSHQQRPLGTQQQTCAELTLFP